MQNRAPPLDSTSATEPPPPLDREARRRLAVIRHVEEVSGNVALSCRYYGISRQAFYIWYRRGRGRRGLTHPLETAKDQSERHR
jgi:transposase-like protein